MLSLQPLSVEIDHRKFKLAAQDAYPIDEGGYTGEVSFTMLGDLVRYAIVGHSSRRIYFNESLELVRDKVQAAVRNGIMPILCVGETKEERRAGETKQVLHDQVTTALQHLTSKDIEHIVIAYEPVWAISTFGGEVAKPSDVEKAIAYIRMQIHELYGAKAALEVRVLYGGSVNEHDALGYLSAKGVDGALVGAASLNYQQFSAIIDAAYRLRTQVQDGR
jgi:triosephosphate isomerase